MDELALSISDLVRDHPAAADGIGQAVIGAALTLDGHAHFFTTNPLHAGLMALRADLLRALPADDLMQVLEAITELDGRCGGWPASELDAKKWQRALAALAGQIQTVRP